MRRVVVRIVRTAIYVHEDPYGRLVPTFKNDGETYESYCHACALERNAIKYERLASTNRKRAAEERTRQAMRHLKPYKTKGASK